jgi:hypothetical protein
MTDAEITELHNETADLQDRIEAQCRRLASIQGLTLGRARAAVLKIENHTAWCLAVVELAHAADLRKLGPNCIQALRVLDMSLQDVIADLDLTIPGGMQKGTEA